jgi:AraC-like DNA-binding protein
MRACRNKCRITRNVERPGAGLLRVEQKVQVSGSERGLDATGRFWMFAVVKIRRGTIEYIRDDDRMACPGPVFGISVPPYSILEVALDQTESDSTAFLSKEQLFPELPGEPVAFDIAMAEIPDSIPELIRHFTERSTTTAIGRCRQPPPLALRTKAAIDNHYSVPMPLSVIAAELGTSASAMSRAFRQSYGMPPVRYRHLLRTMDGMMRLLNGEAIVNVCHNVGFDDLSRFYRQFRRYTLSRPSTYRF